MISDIGRVKRIQAVEEARDMEEREKEREKRTNDGDRRTGRNVTGNLDEVSLSLLSASVDRYIPYRPLSAESN